MTSVDQMGTLTRGELRSFDKQAWELVEAMQAAGWTGRRSGDGHAVMYAPDGQTTTTVARDSKRGRSGRNAKATFLRWQRGERDELAAMDAAHEEEEAETLAVDRYICWHPDHGKEGREFANPRALGIHKASHDREKVICPKCNRPVMYLETHLRKSHAEDTHKLLEGLMSALGELEELRTENAELRRALAAKERS